MDSRKIRSEQKLGESKIVKHLMGDDNIQIVVICEPSIILQWLQIYSKKITSGGIWQTHLHHWLWVRGKDPEFKVMWQGWRKIYIWMFLKLVEKTYKFGLRRGYDVDFSTNK